MKKITALGVGMSVLLLGAIGVRSAHAGSRATAADVDIHQNADGSGYAYGSQGDARNSGNGTGSQLIGCLSWQTPTGGALGCSAVTPSGGAGKSCWASPSFFWSMAFLMSAVTTDSYIYFSWDASGACNGLQIINNSRYQPKKFFSTAP